MKIGDKIIHLESVDSTNNYIANLAKRGDIQSGTVVLADEQFAGKGQRGAEWLVKPGENLTFSFFMDNVNLSVDNQFILTQVVSLSMVHLLNKLGITASIKWPNDIYIKNTKIGGILIENQLLLSQIQSTIVGIGLNINQEVFSEFSATSLLNLTGIRRVPSDVLFSFVDSFNEIWKDYLKSTRASLQEKYLDNLYLLNLESSFEDDNGRFRGEINDVLPNGKLVIKAGDVEREYDLKEIKFLGDSD